MRACVTPLVNGALLFTLSFWLGECRSANNDFFDSVSVDHSPWQPITSNRESPRPSSPKFPPGRYSNPNHAPPPPQWLTSFNRASTTEKFKDNDRVVPNNKPKFPPSVDGYKSYSPGPFYSKEFYDTQPPFNPFQDDYKRPPVHGVKPTKESPVSVYKEPGEPPFLGPKLKPTTPSAFDFPPELNTGPASFPAHSFSDSRKKIKFPPPTGSSGFVNEKLNSLKTNVRYPIPLEHDPNSVRDAPTNDTGAWKDHAHEGSASGSKNRGHSKFHQNSVAVREVSPSEAPQSDNVNHPSQKPGQRIALNRTATRPENKVGANELKPQQPHVIYNSNSAQLVEDGSPGGLSDSEEFRPKEFTPGNIVSQVTSVRTRQPTIKPLQVDAVKTSPEQKFKPQSSENSTEKQLQNELANTVPILESVPNNDKPREPPASEETSAETKKKFPFRRPQLLTTTSTERPTTYEPSRRPTMKGGLKNRINLNQKLRTSTESLASTPGTEPPIRVKNHKEDGAVQSNDIPLKTAARPTVDYNRRRPARPNQGDISIPPTGWALASFKNFTSRSTRRPPTESPAVGVTEMPAKVKPFVAWSTRLQKMTTTESSATDMTTLMDDEEEVTTFIPDTTKSVYVTSSTPGSLNNSRDSTNSSKVAEKISSVNVTINSTTSSEEMNNIGIEKNDKKTNVVNHLTDENIENDAASPNGDENITEDVNSYENEESMNESEMSNADTEKDKKNDKIIMSNMNVTSTSSSTFSPSKIKNETSSVKPDFALDTTVIKESPNSDDSEKPTESPVAPENDEIEFVEATNNSNAHGLDDMNNLKTKPVETIYLTDIKPEVVGLTNSIRKDSEVSSVTNSSFDNLVNKNETHTSFNVPLLTTSVPFSKNYQNNSSQSNELNTDNVFGVLKGVSSHDFDGNKSHPPATDILNGIKETNEYPTETEGMFEVSFDSPGDKTPSTEGNKLSNVDVSEKVSQFPTASVPSIFSKETPSQFSPSSIPNVSNEEIPDFEFSSVKPHLSTEFGVSSTSFSFDKSTTEGVVKIKDNKTVDLEMSKPLSPHNREQLTSSVPTTTVSVQHLSPSVETTLFAEKTSPTTNENDTVTTATIFDLGSRGSSKSASSTNWPPFGISKTSTSQPFSKIEYITTKTSMSPTTVSSTMKISTTTKKHENVIPLVPDKFNENGATDEDVYIETDSDQDSTSTIPPKIPVTTAKAPSSNLSSEISEADLCPSAALCPVPLHVQLRIEMSQSEVCKTLNKLKNSIIKLFRSGTARVQRPEQIKFVNLNSKNCPKEGYEKMSDVSFYLSDGIGDFEQSINEEFVELYRKMGLQDYEPKVESAHLVMNKGSDKDEGLESEMDGSKTRVIAAVVIICLAVICLILVILLLMIIRKRQKRFNYGQRCVPVTLDDYSLDNISVYNSVRRKGDARASKRSYGNPAFDDPNGPTHRMNFAGLANFASDQHAIDEEFSSIPVVAVKPDELPPSAETKNRYANVIPLPETRVHLLNTKTGGCSDYINANFVKGPKREEKFYIACQAPLQATIEDFWRMIWEQQSKVILMLTDFFENGVEKCANYLPPSEVIDCNRVFGDFQVTLKKRENREKYIISSLQLKNLETNSWREVTHLWYTSWPPLGVPNEESSIIAFLIEARVYMKNNPGPNIVHCSPGTGRTGTVIACDLCIRDFELTRMIDVPKCVYMLRRCRAGAVQTKQQYAFIYKVLNLYAAKLTGGGLDSI